MTADPGHDDPTIDTRDDDEALSWGPASSDVSYLEGPQTSAVADDPDEADDDELPEGVLSSTMLVVHGVFAAILLLYTVAWLKSIGSVQPSFASPTADWMWRIGTWFAVAAPALWFVGVVLLVPTSASRRRFLALLVGVVLLFPWAFVMGYLS